MKAKTALSLVALAALAGTAQADEVLPPGGFYVAARAGVTQFRSVQNTVQSSVVAGALTDTIDKISTGDTSRTQFSPSLAVGYSFDTPWQQPIRLEMAWTDDGRLSQNSTVSTSLNSAWTSGSGYNESLPATVAREQNIRVSTLMLNGYYDYTTGTSVTPYVMAGVGMAFLRSTTSMSQSSAGVDLSSDDFSKRTSDIAWSVGAGLSWAVTQHLALEAGYTYTSAGDVTTTGTSEDGIISGTWSSHTRVQLHMLHTGLRYTF